MCPTANVKISTCTKIIRKAHVLIGLERAKTFKLILEKKQD